MAQQEELLQVIDIAKNHPEIIGELEKRMAEKKRGMIFFKWYGKNIAQSLKIPAFHSDYKYVRTIGISVFNKHQKTAAHFGPLRLMFRALYNLTPIQNDNVYIVVKNQMHKWYDNPLFIFDDTLLHQSVNDVDQLRYALFLDITRPTQYPCIMNFLIKMVRCLMFASNHLFYKNWDVLK